MFFNPLVGSILSRQVAWPRIRSARGGRDRPAERQNCQIVPVGVRWRKKGHIAAHAAESVDTKFDSPGVAIVYYAVPFNLQTKESP